jgi:endonuclease III
LARRKGKRLLFVEGKWIVMTNLQNTKQPFELEAALARLRVAVEPLPKAALFELAERGYNTLFEQLVACIISIRTYDEVMLPTALRLFAKARTPQAMIELSVAEIDALIEASTFHERKAPQIHQIAQRIVQQYAGSLPCERDVLLSFAGVGPKCANLALGIACNEPWIGVDIHVHRVTNRWGYVAASTPERTLSQLEALVPRAHWLELNRLLVPFGKHVCTGSQPRCSTCPLLDMCQQVGVNAHR